MISATAQAAQHALAAVTGSLARTPSRFSGGALPTAAHRGWQTQSGFVSTRQSSGRSHISPLCAEDAADAVRETLSGISSNQGRIAQTTNVVLGGGDNSLERWRELDEKVNMYPTERSFKAIGSGGDDFVASMVGAVETAVGVKPSKVQQRPSANGKYVSVTIGPVVMQNADQVIQVYSEMREDDRLKWYL